jgi:hypothetical protein
MPGRRLHRANSSGCECGKLWSFGGAVAQLGARLDGIEEVVGSNPIGSTNIFKVQTGHIGDTLYRLHG